jgi:hypothetical protein
MWPLKNKSPEFQIEQVEAQLRSFMPKRFRASYDPAFPGSNGKIFRWFQVCFEVGPGEDSFIRTQVHDLFERMLAVLSELNLVYESDHVSLRARRHYPDSKTYNPDHPFMFIEVDWSGSAIQAMRKQASFSAWAAICLTYRNCFDKNDPLTRNYSEKNSPFADVQV